MGSVEVKKKLCLECIVSSKIIAIFVMYMFNINGSIIEFSCM